MNKTLYLVCPFNHSESLVRSLFHEEAYFLTAPGCVFNCHEINYASAIAAFLTNHSIDHIKVVQRVECRFIRNAITFKPESGMNAEKVLAGLVQKHYSDIMTPKSVETRKERLARRNLERQMKELFDNEVLQKAIVKNQIRISGLLFTKNEFERVGFEPRIAHRNYA
jgi:carbonic anhydrase